MEEGDGGKPSTSFYPGQGGTRGCLHASIWHLVNELSATVLRKKPLPTVQDTFPKWESANFPKLKTHPGWSCLWVGHLRGSRAGRGGLQSRGWASHPARARTPSPWRRPKPALFTESVSSISPSPSHHFPFSPGGWEPGRRGLKEPRRQPNPRRAPQYPSPPWLLGSSLPAVPVFWFSL